MRVLIVKISSMGDLIHALPALSDAAKAIPGIQFDWVVEKGFSEVPLWHPNVNQVITSSHRAWKRNLWQGGTCKEFLQFVKKLRSKRYDLVIDAQSSIKSSVVTALARGPACGMDRSSVREWGAHLVYRKKIAVPRKQHAMLRLRQLFAGALGYALPNDPPDFALDRSTLPKITFPLPKRYVVFIHHASWASKCWPETHWHQLIEIAAADGYAVLLPWGNAAEEERAKRLASNHDNAMVLPRMSISELANILWDANGVVCCDTGLGHLSAALSIPTLTLYGSTDPSLLAIEGNHHIQMQSSFHCVMCYQRACSIAGPEENKPICLAKILPKSVWNSLLSVMA